MSPTHRSIEGPQSHLDLTNINSAMKEMKGGTAKFASTAKEKIMTDQGTKRSSPCTRRSRRVPNRS